MYPHSLTATDFTAFPQLGGNSSHIKLCDRLSVATGARCGPSTKWHSRNSWILLPCVAALAEAVAFALAAPGCRLAGTYFCPNPQVNTCGRHFSDIKGPQDEVELAGAMRRRLRRKRSVSHFGLVGRKHFACRFMGILQAPILCGVRHTSACIPDCLRKCVCKWVCGLRCVYGHTSYGLPRHSAVLLFCECI